MALWRCTTCGSVMRIVPGDHRCQVCLGDRFHLELDETVACDVCGDRLVHGRGQAYCKRCDRDATDAR